MNHEMNSQMNLKHMIVVILSPRGTKNIVQTMHLTMSIAHPYSGMVALPSGKFLRVRKVFARCP